MTKQRMNNLLVHGKKAALIALLSAMPLTNVKANNDNVYTYDKNGYVYMSYEQIERENAENIMKLLGLALAFVGGRALWKLYTKENESNQKQR